MKEICMPSKSEYSNYTISRHRSSAYGEEKKCSLEPTTYTNIEVISRSWPRGKINSTVEAILRDGYVVRFQNKEFTYL